MRYQQLTRDVRCQINTLVSTGMIQKDIAEQLGVSPSTICRELKRNTGQKGYRYKQADAKAVGRRHEASSRPKKMLPSLIEVIEEKLLEKWSPEQISGVLESNDILISHESIYRHIWAGPFNTEVQFVEAC